MSRPFEVTRELQLPAVPEDVWTAVTSDVAAWQFPAGLDLPTDGSTPGAPVVGWDPPRLFAIRTEAPDGAFNSLEYAIEAADGGTARLRYVHAGILPAGWEDQYDAIGPHTDFYLHTLGQYLQHFFGRPVRYVGEPSAGVVATAPGATAPGAMDALRTAVGVKEVGERVDTTVAGARVEGVVDYATPDFLGVRTADALYRFFGRNRWGSAVGLSVHDFGGGAPDQEALLQWLDALYA
jgi:hypothetical protein